MAVIFASEIDVVVLGSSAVRWVFCRPTSGQYQGETSNRRGDLDDV